MKRCVAAVLGAALLLPASASAERWSALPNVSGAVVEKTEFSDTTATPDGRRRTQVAPYPINFKNDEGTWEAIDTSLVPAGGGDLRPAALDGDAVIPPTLAEPVVLEHDGSEISFRLRGAQGVRSQTDEQATFSAALPGVDVQYQARSLGVKETIVLKSAQAPQVFRYDLSADADLTASVNAGTIVLRDEDGKERFRIDAPAAWDSAAPASFSNAIDLDVEKTGTGKWVVTVEPDSAWLSSPDRVYPLYVDPDYYWVTSTRMRFHGATDCYIENGNFANLSYCASTTLRASRKASEISKPMFKFDIATAIPANANVTKARLFAFSPGVVERFDHDMRLRTITADWDSNVTWNHRKTGVPWTTPGGDVSTDPALTSAPEPVGYAGYYYSWEAPLQTIKKWVDGTLPNYGFQLDPDVLAYPNDPNHSSYFFTSTENFQSSQWPLLDVTWTMPIATGATPMDTFASQKVDATSETDSALLRGLDDVNVNVVTGNVVLSELDLPQGTPELIRYYNSNANADTGFGPGWQLAAGSAVRLVEQVNGNVVFMDPTGAALTFTPDVSGGYRSPSNARNARLTVHSSGRAEVEDLDGRFEFSNLHSSLSAYWTADGTKVTLRSDGLGTTDSNGHAASFVRDGEGRITSITTPTDGTFTYSYNSAGRLVANSTPGYGTTTYEYNSAGRLNSFARPNGWNTKFDYDVQGRVAAIRRFSPANDETQTSFTYTTFTTSSVTLGAQTTYTHDGTRVNSAVDDGAPSLSASGPLWDARDQSLDSGTSYALALSSTSTSDIAKLGITALPGGWLDGLNRECATGSSCGSAAGTYEVAGDEIPPGNARLAFSAVDRDGRQRTIYWYASSDPLQYAGDPSGPDEPDLSAPDEQQHQQDTRSALGLDSSAQALLDAAQSGIPVSDATGGIPVTATEKQALDSHSLLDASRADIEAYAASHYANSYAGAYLDRGTDGGGALHLGFTSNVSDSIQDLKSNSLFGDRIVGFGAERSLARLSAVQAAIDGDTAASVLPSGVLVLGTDIDVQATRITAYVESNAELAVDALREKYGSFVDAKLPEEGDATAGRVPRRRNQFAFPKLAGLRIFSRPFLDRECSLGFSLLGHENSKGVTIGMSDRGVATGDVVTAFSLTAGHCPGSESRYVQGDHAYAKVEYANYFPGTAADAALLRPKLFAYRSTKVWVGPGKTVDVPSFESKHAKTGGRRVCFMSNAINKPVCGNITNESTVFKSHIPQLVTPISASREIDRPCYGGDSGGPVWSHRAPSVAYPGGARVAEGIIIGNNAKDGQLPTKCYFSQIEHAVDILKDKAGLKTLHLDGGYKGKRSQASVDKLQADTRPRLVGCDTFDVSCHATPGVWPAGTTIAYAAKLCGSASDCGTPSTDSTAQWISEVQGICTRRTSQVTVIASGRGGPTYVPLQGPSVMSCNGGPSGTRAVMTWDTNQVDIDLYAFDNSGHVAFYRDRTAIPGADLSPDNRFGYGPETFTELIDSGRAYAFGVCMYSGAKPTVVSLTVTDPAGTTRSFTRQLSQSGEFSLVTSSPMTPTVGVSVGWCRSRIR